MVQVKELHDTQQYYQKLKQSQPIWSQIPAEAPQKEHLLQRLQV